MIISRPFAELKEVFSKLPQQHTLFKVFGKTQKVYINFDLGDKEQSTLFLINTAGCSEIQSESASPSILQASVTNCMVMSSVYTS